MSRRTEKVAALIHKGAGEYLSLLELSGLTTISKVEVTPDLKWGKVWVTIMGSVAVQRQTLGEIVEQLPEFQHGLIRKLKMKIVPRVSFVLDHGEEYAAHINELLKKTHDDEQ